jgi:hypothetical protein
VAAAIYQPSWPDQRNDIASILLDTHLDPSEDDYTRTMQQRTNSMTAGTRTNDKALATFMARKTEIDDMLARLQALSEEHFNANPEDIHWGHVGDLADIAQKLSEITDRAFGEAEYAG